MSEPLNRERSCLRAFQAYVPPAAAAVLDLDRRSCRWPLGEPDSDGFRFCGAPRTRACYCQEHNRLAIRRRH